MRERKGKPHRSRSALRKKRLERARELICRGNSIIDEIIDELGEEEEEGDVESTVHLPADSVAYLAQMGLPGIRLKPVGERMLRLTAPGTDLPALEISRREGQLVEQLAERAQSRQAKESSAGAWMTYAELAIRLRPGRPISRTWVSQLVCRVRQRGWTVHFIITSRRLRAACLRMYVPPARAAANAVTV